MYFKVFMYYMLIIIIFFTFFLFFNIFFFKKKEIFQIESGFQNMNQTSFKNFSINFFFLLVIYIIFDLELIMAIPSVFKKNMIFNLLCFSFIFFTFLIEWISKKILWKN